MHLKIVRCDGQQVTQYHWEGNDEERQIVAVQVAWKELAGHPSFAGYSFDGDEP